MRERDFTRDASHELRTPLTVIRVASDLIAHDDGLSSASRRSLGRIQDAVAGMEAIIDALLLLARGEQTPLESEEVRVREVVEQELERVLPLLRYKGLELRLEIEADPILHAPPRVLQVMLGNLLGNAVRFTDAGGVRVCVQADRLCVEDTGIGMDAATLARAFEPFYRGEGEQVTGFVCSSGWAGGSLSNGAKFVLQAKSGKWYAPSQDPCGSASAGVPPAVLSEGCGS